MFSSTELNFDVFAPFRSVPRAQLRRGAAKLDEIGINESLTDEQFSTFIMAATFVVVVVVGSGAFWLLSFFHSRASLAGLQRA